MAVPTKPRRRTGEFGGSRKFTPRRKVCMFCVDKIDQVDYKDVNRLRRFLSDRGKIEPRRKTGTCATHQRSLNTALKRARHLALLPFTAEHIRITGVLIREPGASVRGPRPPRPGGDGVEAADGTVADGTAAPAEAAPLDAVAPDAVPTPAADSEPAPVAEAEPVPVAEAEPAPVADAEPTPAGAASS
jgi:small subunit ribosomal protein S18